MYVGGWCPSCKQNGRPTVLVCLGSSLSLSGSLSIDPPSPLRQAPKNTFFPFSQQVSVIPPLLFACIFRLTQKKRVVTSEQQSMLRLLLLLPAHICGVSIPPSSFLQWRRRGKKRRSDQMVFPVSWYGGTKAQRCFDNRGEETEPHFFSAKDLFFFLPRQPTDPPFLWRFMGKKWSGKRKSIRIPAPF